MEKTIIQTDAAPAAIGTYSQAVRVGQTVYLSGQIPLHPETMQVISDDIAEQIEQVFKNVKALCEASGGDLGHIVKLNIYLTDLGCFEKVNESMARFFQPPYPARAAVQVAALPKGVQVEMDAVLVLGPVDNSSFRPNPALNC